MRRQRLATVWEVPVEIGLGGIGVCLLLLLVIDALSIGPTLRDPSQLLVLALAEVLVLVFVTVSHELGHAMVWRCLGIKVYRCEIHGLYAKTVRAPAADVTRNRQCLAIVAGPLVNLFLASLFVPFLTIPLPAMWALLVHYIFLGNVVVALSNLIPVDPLDGGRIRRLLL